MPSTARPFQLLAPPARRVLSALTALAALVLHASPASGATIQPPAATPRQRAVGGRVEQPIGRDWTFRYDPAPEPDARPARPDFDDARWSAVALPHTWSTYETTGELHPFIRSASERDDSYWWYGWGWYRKRLVVGAEYRDRLVALEFDGVQKYARVYVNGALVGEHRGGYTSFSVDVTRQIRFGAENVIAVQVSNRRDDAFGGIPPMNAGNFDVYGGIYRDVRLVLRDRLSVPFQGAADHEGGTFVTTPSVSEDSGTVDVRTWVRNDYASPRTATVVTTVRDAAGTVVSRASSAATIAPGETRELAQRLGPVRHPHLWSPDAPYLYRVDTEVRDGARTTDTYRSPLGFRWFRWSHDERRLYLNGKPLVLRGINRHQEYPWLGDAMPKWIHRADLLDIRRNMGLYFQRTVHYPNDPYVYALSDSLGVLTMEEVPNIKDIAFGRDVQRAMLTEAIRRDRNHPSIIMWSIGNETNQPADSRWAHDADTTRIVYLRRGENGGDFVQLTDTELPIENLLRCTVRGWYTSDDRDFGPETRDPASGQVTGTEWWQHEATTRAQTLTEGNVVVWLYADHGADREYVNSPLLHVNPKGWTDAYRVPKYVYYLWQANFTRFATRPMVFVEPHYWREQYLGERKPIIVDSNGDEVVLFVNGREIGRRRPTAANNHSVTFDSVEIVRGTLTAEARNGSTRVTTSVRMAGAPARLVLRTSSGTSAPGLTADRASVAIVTADVVDSAGVHVYGASPTLHWHVDGPARLVGPSVYRTDTEKKEAMEGTLYIDAPVSNVVRATAEPGVVRVTVSARGLAPATIALRSSAVPDAIVAGIDQPRLRDAGRLAVTRDTSYHAVAAAKKPSAKQTVAEIGDDAEFARGDRGAYRAQLVRFVLARNPKLDTTAAKFRAFVDRLAQIVEQRDGRLVADDYNFNARQYAASANGSANASANASAAGGIPELKKSSTLADERHAIRAALFVPEPPPPLQVERYGEFEAAPGVTAERVSYATTYGLRVPAIVYRPTVRPAARMPGLVVVNGHGGDKTSWYAYYAGILYARAGAVVVTYDPIGEGERNAERRSGTRQHDRALAPPEMARRLSGLMITDVMQAVSYLARRADVDSARIGAVGYSMGSFVLGLTCAVDPRINACVLAGGGNLDSAGGYWDSSDKRMCQAIPYQSLAFLGDRGAALYHLHAARGGTLVINGSADDVVAIPATGGAAFFAELRRRTVALHGSDRNVFDAVMVPGGGHRPYFLGREAALWLERRLDFPAWTAASIAAMPETHVSEWARARGVPIDALYATELREGGTRALGDDVPALARERLMALPRERWERERRRYVYETWVQEATARVEDAGGDAR